MAMVTTELSQACDKMLKLSKELTNVMWLKLSIKLLDDNVAFDRASEEKLKNELAAGMKKSFRLNQLVDDIFAEMVDLRELLRAADGVIRFIIEDSCASLGPSLWGLVDSFHVGLNKSVDDSFRAASIHFRCHADTAIDDITLRFLDGAASDNGDGLTKGADVSDPPIDSDVIQL